MSPDSDNASKTPFAIDGKFAVKLVQTPCDNKCGHCYLTPDRRKHDPLFTQEQLEAILMESKGATAVSLVAGEHKNYKEQILFPVLELAAEHNYPNFTTFNSGIHLTEEDLEKILDIFPGEIYLTVSVDPAPWGHKNNSPQAENGDILPKFVKFRDENPGRVNVSVVWTHMNNPKYQEYGKVRDAYEQRCKGLGVPFWWGYASGKKWTPKVNPWKRIQEEGWDLKIENEGFTCCYLPVEKYGRKNTSVKVTPEGIYTPCQDNLFKIGEVGTLGEGGLKKAVENFYQNQRVFAELMLEGGLFRVAQELYNTPHLKAEVVEVLNQEFDLHYGGCDLCAKLVPLLEKA